MAQGIFGLRAPGPSELRRQEAGAMDSCRSWAQRYAEEKGAPPADVQQLLSFAKNRGGALTYREARQAFAEMGSPPQRSGDEGASSSGEPPRHRTGGHAAEADLAGPARGPVRGGRLQDAAAPTRAAARAVRTHEQHIQELSVRSLAGTVLTTLRKVDCRCLVLDIKRKVAKRLTEKAVFCTGLQLVHGVAVLDEKQRVSELGFPPVAEVTAILTPGSRVSGMAYCRELQGAQDVAQLQPASPEARFCQASLILSGEFHWHF
uniref:Uncharacterized protein n=1 Tax=Alexandrium monilatum TaxID=311494 RepID=A0A7S4W8Y1_9DINO